MAAKFHPSEELLLDYASGALREAASLVIATHLALCPACRKTVQDCEAIGGTLLEQGESVAVSGACRDKVMALLDAQEQPAAPGKPAYDPFFCNVLPAPLRGYVGCGVSNVPWQRISSTVETAALGSCKCSAGTARLIRVKAGAALPRHTHSGQEYTVVLSGSYRDGGNLYRRGDFVACGSEVQHAPVAGEAEDCVCLVALEGRMQLSGLLGRLLTPFLRF